MVDTARGMWVRVGSTWKRVDPADTGAGLWARVGGVWKVVEGGWVRVNNTWKQFYPVDDETEPPDPGPTPGTYILAPTSLYLGGLSGYASYDTTPYRGHITEIRARISWLNTGAFDVSVSGRPNNNFYRSIAADWGGQTIDHRIDTFDSTSISDFNSGAATGFNLSKPATTPLDVWMSNVQLNLTVA